MVVDEERLMKSLKKDSQTYEQPHMFFTLFLSQKESVLRLVWPIEYRN